MNALQQMTVKSIIFDYDETLADNSFKSTGEGYLWTVQAVSPDLADVCVRLMNENQDWRTWNRYEFFRRLLILGNLRQLGSFDEERLKEDADIARLAEAFSCIVVEKTIESGLYEGVIETLELLASSGISMYVVSGTAHADILEITTANGIQKIVQGVYGFGWSTDSTGIGLGKEEAYADIFSNDAIAPEYRMVVGDGFADRALAEYIGCRFVGLPRTYTNNWPEVNSDDGLSVYGDMVLIDSVARLKYLVS